MDTLIEGISNETLSCLDKSVSIGNSSLRASRPYLMSVGN